MIEFHTWFNITKYHDLEVMWQEWKSFFIALCNKHAHIKL